jgi:hypothetical protein
MCLFGGRPFYDVELESDEEERITVKHYHKHIRRFSSRYDLPLCRCGRRNCTTVINCGQCSQFLSQNNTIINGTVIHPTPVHYPGGMSTIGGTGIFGGTRLISAPPTSIGYPPRVVSYLPRNYRPYSYAYPVYPSYPARTYTYSSWK